MSYLHANIEQTNKITFFWNRKDNLQNSDIWVWWKGKAGKGYELHPCEYGAQCTINVPKNIDCVGFIVRTNCSDPCGTKWGTAHKDWDQDRKTLIDASNVKIYLRSGDGNQYHSLDNGKTLELIKTFSFAEIIDRNKIRFHVSPCPSADFFEVNDPDSIKVQNSAKTTVRTNNQDSTNSSNANNKKVKVIDSNGNALEIKTLYFESSNGAANVANIASRQNSSFSSFPSVNTSENSSTGIIELRDNLDISQCYTVELDGYGKKGAVPTQVFDSPWFIENYTYNDNDLGSKVQENGTTVFKIWAPTAQKVELNLFENGHDSVPFKTQALEKSQKGVWQATVNCASRTYYTYSITTALGKKETADPYAVAAGVNGNHSMVIDMKETNPRGFEQDTYKKDISSYSNAVVWEIHVRDFSNKNPLSKYPGKYLAFTEENQKIQIGENEIPIGLEHIKNLGITHVQLNPVFDFATVDESSDLPQFNWGYDPQNFNVLEGSFSTDPYHGEVRINEFKRMVKTLHDNNIGVIMDVVYNHTYDTNSSFNKTVPYYYYRYNSNGENSNGSGCGNETASQRYMVRKFIIDSIRFWATEYHIDGFRFDLMAIHDIDTMQEVEKTLHEINPHALLYGEGWAGGSCALDSSLLATQNNISRIQASPKAIGAVAVFNDVIRDGLKGNVFEVQSRGYINNGANYDNANKVCFGLKGGVGTHKIHWKVDNAMVVNYLSSHDNNTLWDKLKLSNINSNKHELVQMNKLGATCVLISKGISFMLAGEEMLRSKNGDGNSYNSSDEINNLDWKAFVQDKDSQDMIMWYKNLIEMRMENSFIKDCYVSCNIIECNMIEVFYHKENSLQGYAIINPNDYALRHTLPHGKWKPLLIGDKFFKTKSLIGNNLSCIEGMIEVPAKAVILVSFTV